MFWKSLLPGNLGFLHRNSHLAGPLPYLRLAIYWYFDQITTYDLPMQVPRHDKKKSLFFETHFGHVAFSSMTIHCDILDTCRLFATHFSPIIYYKLTVNCLK